MSVCLIAKDEEAPIGLCLDSVASFAHEIILVDTNRLIRRRYRRGVSRGFTIHGRMISVMPAMYLWNMRLGTDSCPDADERLNVEDIPTLQRELKQSGILNYRLPIHNHGAKEYGHRICARLYRNAPAWHRSYP